LYYALYKNSENLHSIGYKNNHLNTENILLSSFITIVADGEAVSAQRLRRLTQNGTLLIAADGAALACRKAGLTPDYIIGDFDSITPELRAYFNAVSFIKRGNQEFTDLQKALDFALERKPDSLRIIAPFGKRTDHAMANMLFLQEYAQKIPLEIFDPYGQMHLLPQGRHTLQGKPGQTVSLLAFKPLQNLTLSGFLYPVNGKDFGWFAGISNVYRQKTCLVEFRGGPLIIYEVTAND